jgi:hypothetical protein
MTRSVEMLETDASTVADRKEGRRLMSHEKGWDAIKPKSFLIRVT